MAEQLRFHPLVAEDLKAAVGWYDDISPGLGDRFRIAVEQRFDSVAEFPESFGIVFQNARAARISVFPYLLLFEYLMDVVHILGVFHSASNPAKWRGRLR
jgi:plasmid stabilization system protein ParE